MKKILTLAVLASTLAASAHAQSPTISSAFTILRAAAGGNVFFDLNSDTANPDFTGTVMTVFEGENLFLGGEANTPHYSCNTQEAWVDQVTMYYRINGGPTNSLPLPLFIDSNPDKWQQGTDTGMVEVASILQAGSHTVEVYFVGVDVNFCMGGGISTRLPASGFYTASFEVIPSPREVIAADDAAQRGYLAGWTNLSQSGHGFGPWTQLTFTEDGAAGFFLNTALTSPVASRAKAWGLYANEGGEGGDQIQIAAAFRPIDPPLQVGQTLLIDFQHGGIQAGSLSENNPPRTGGWVGFALRDAMPPLFGDPDPFSAFGTFQNAIMGAGFQGGDTDYRAYDINNTLGYYTGLKFTTSGVRAELTFTTTNNFTLKLSDLGTGSNVTVFGVTVGGPPSVLAVYNRNAEEADAFFNSVYIIDGINAARAAADNAADAAYLPGWTNGLNGGFGFNPWLFGIATDGGSAGTFLATNPPNTDLNAIATDGRAWGMYANDFPSGGVQQVTAFRYFADGDMAEGQAFGAAFEHGGISPVNGEIELMLLGTPTFVNEQGEILAFEFPGGASNYRMFDDLGLFQTHVPWGDGGLKFHLDVLRAGPPVFYALTVDTRGTAAATYRICGEMEDLPLAMRFRITDTEEADVFLNSLYLTGVDSIVDFLIGRLSVQGSAGIAFESEAGRLYSLEHRDNLVSGFWAGVPGQTNIPGTGGELVLTGGTAGAEAYFRVASTNAP